jgi:hypothetical protein
MSTKFVVFDKDHVWGIGNSEEKAIAEAKSWYKNAEGDFERDTASGKIHVAPCSESIINHIESQGGNNVMIIKNNAGEAILVSRTPVDTVH